MKKNNIRVFIVFIVSLLFLVVVAINVFYVTILKVHLLSQKDLEQYADQANIKTEIIQATRGNIFDKNGNVIVQDNKTYNIICYLDENRSASKNRKAYVDDPRLYASLLAPILKGDEETIFQLLNKKQVNDKGEKIPNVQTELGNVGRNLSKATKEEIESIRIKDNDTKPTDENPNPTRRLSGIEFTSSIKRSYPMGVFSSNLIGYAQAEESVDNDKKSHLSVVGKMGLEKDLDEYLRGTDGYRWYQADQKGNILSGMKVEETSSINGNDVYLTLDRGIQETMEQSFKQTVSIFGAERVWGSVMEISSGKILAWGQSPSFDPNELIITDYNNYGSQLPYEPGSTMKTFAWAAAINEGKYDGNQTVYSGPFCYSANNRDPYRVASGGLGCITNSGYKNWGDIGYDYGLIYSSNAIASSVITELITPEIYEDYLNRFHFFQKVNTEGMKEEVGKKNYTWPIEKLALSYGQGSTVTMLQLMQAYSAVFGNGEMVKPYVVESVRDPYNPSNVIVQNNREVVGTPITSDTAKQLQEILWKVAMQDDGTAKHYRIPETDIMAKTGTTQLAVGGSYKSGVTIISLMAALPADNPKYMVYYAFQAKYDRNAHYKTEPIKMLLRKVAMTYNLDHHSDLLPNVIEKDGVLENGTISTYSMPNLVNHSLDYSVNKLSSISNNIIVLGQGKTVIDQFPHYNDPVKTNEKIFLQTDTSSWVMPSLLGWTKKDVGSLWSITRNGFTIKGNGHVVSQSIQEGELVGKDVEIEVSLE